MEEECSICLSAFNEPKTLPCDHTFCRECLQTYIDKENVEESFTCPLCRRKTKPPDGEKPKSEWASFYPTNENILNPVKQGPGMFKLIGSLTLKRNLCAGINDMVMLIDKSFIITDACYKKVWKFSKSGEYLQDTPFDKEPFGLCLLQDNCVAVSIPHNKKIIILDCKNLKTVKDTLSFEKSYSGLGSDDKKRIFSLYRDKNIFVDIIAKSNPQSSYAISHVIKLPFYFCGIYRLRVLPSGYILMLNFITSWKLCCVDQKGNMIFQYEGHETTKLTSTSDVAVGTHFIYVVDKTTNTIHRIEHYGNFVDIPFTASDGISRPNKIYVNDEGVAAMYSKVKQNNKIELFSC